MKKKTENKITYQDDKIIKFLIESSIYGNKEVIIDSEYWNEIREYRWSLHLSKTTKSGFYIRNTDRRHNRILLHRLILKLNDPKILVDHINHNTFDNRKENLRKCNPTESLRNRTKQENNTSGFKGVSWHISKQKWMAYIGLNNKQVYIGLFEDATSAAKAYNKKAIELFGDYAVLNQVESI